MNSAFNSVKLMLALFVNSAETMVRDAWTDNKRYPLILQLFLYVFFPDSVVAKINLLVLLTQFQNNIDELNEDVKHTKKAKIPDTMQRIITYNLKNRLEQVNKRLKTVESKQQALGEGLDMVVNDCIKEDQSI